MGILIYTYTTLAHSDCVHSPKRRREERRLKKQILRDYLLGRTTYNIIPEYRQVIKAQYQEELKNKVYDASKSKRAPISRAGCNIKDSLFQQSAKTTCPSYTVLDVNHFRSPRTIVKSVCACKRCLSVSNRSKRETSNCTPVNTYIPVIRYMCPKQFGSKKSTKRYFEYKITLETVPVGCTCERAESV